MSNDWYTYSNGHTYLTLVDPYKIIVFVLYLLLLIMKYFVEN